MNNKLTLGWAIRNGRRRLGLSQKELGKLIFIDWIILSKLENDRISITEFDPIILINLAKILDIDLRYLKTLAVQTEIESKIKPILAIFPVYYERRN